MKLNDININDTISRCNMKWNGKKWAINNIITFLIAVSVSAGLSLVTKVNPSYPAMLACIGAKALAEVGAYGFIKYKANKKLKQLVTILRNDGYKVSKLNLKKAKLGTKLPERVMTGTTLSKVTEDVTVFKDNLGQLKALRQVRSEIISELKNPSKEDVILLGDYTEYIDSPEEAQKVLAKMKG